MRRSVFSKFLLEISALFQGARELLEPRHKTVGASSEYWVTDIDELIVVAPWRKSLQQLFVVLRKRQPELGLDFWPGDPGRDRRDTSSRANQRQVLIHEFPYNAGYIGPYYLGCFLPHTDAQGLCHSCSERGKRPAPWTQAKAGAHRRLSSAPARPASHTACSHHSTRCRPQVVNSGGTANIQAICLDSQSEPQRHSHGRLEGSPVGKRKRLCAGPVTELGVATGPASPR